MSVLEQIRIEEGYIVNPKSVDDNIFHVYKQNGEYQFYKGYIGKQYYVGKVLTTFPVKFPLLTLDTNIFIHEIQKQNPPKKKKLEIDFFRDKQPLKITPNYGTENFAGVKKPKVVQSGNSAIPFQPSPITIDNFFIRTCGWFSEIPEVPAGFTSFFKSRGSEYFTNEAEDTVVRVSDHWGYAIRFCNWQLKGYPPIPSQAWHKVNGKGKKIGLIEFKKLEVNNYYSKSVFNPERTVKKSLEVSVNAPIK